MSDLDVTALAASLAETAAHLDEHIARRAEELATPQIQADVAASVEQHVEACRREMWVLLHAQAKAAERLKAERDEARAKLAEFEAVQGAVTKGDRLDRSLTVSDVLVAHEVNRKALADALGAGWHLNWAQLIEAATRQHEVAAEMFGQLEEAHRLASTASTFEDWHALAEYLNDTDPMRRMRRRAKTKESRP